MKKGVKFSEDPLSRRCGYAGCGRWLKHKRTCAPCAILREEEMEEIAEWNQSVREDKAVITTREVIH